MMFCNPHICTSFQASPYQKPPLSAESQGTDSTGFQLCHTSAWHSFLPDGNFLGLQIIFESHHSGTLSGHWIRDIRTPKFIF